MADGTFRSLFAALSPNKPNPVSTGTGFNSGSLLGRPTPIPSVPGYNPMGKKRPQSPSPIPGVTGYGSGLTVPASGRTSLLGR